VFYSAFLLSDILTPTLPFLYFFLPIFLAKPSEHNPSQYMRQKQSLFAQRRLLQKQKSQAPSGEERKPSASEVGDSERTNDTNADSFADDVFTQLSEAEKEAMLQEALEVIPPEKMEILKQRAARRYAQEHHQIIASTSIPKPAIVQDEWPGIGGDFQHSFLQHSSKAYFRCDKDGSCVLVDNDADQEKTEHLSILEMATLLRSTNNAQRKLALGYLHALFRANTFFSAEERDHSAMWAADVRNASLFEALNIFLHVDHRSEDIHGLRKALDILLMILKLLQKNAWSLIQSLLHETVHCQQIQGDWTYPCAGESEIGWTFWMEDLHDKVADASLSIGWDSLAVIVSRMVTSTPAELPRDVEETLCLGIAMLALSCPVEDLKVGAEAAMSVARFCYAYFCAHPCCSEPVLIALYGLILRDYLPLSEEMPSFTLPFFGTDHNMAYPSHALIYTLLQRKNLLSPTDSANARRSWRSWVLSFHNSNHNHNHNHNSAITTISSRLYGALYCMWHAIDRALDDAVEKNALFSLWQSLPVPPEFCSPHSSQPTAHTIRWEGMLKFRRFQWYSNVRWLCEQAVVQKGAAGRLSILQAAIRSILAQEPAIRRMEPSHSDWSCIQKTFLSWMDEWVVEDLQCELPVGLVVAVQNLRGAPPQSCSHWLLMQGPYSLDMMDIVCQSNVWEMCSGELRVDLWSEVWLATGEDNKDRWAAFEWNSIWCKSWKVHHPLPSSSSSSSERVSWQVSLQWPIENVVRELSAGWCLDYVESLVDVAFALILSALACPRLGDMSKSIGLLIDFFPCHHWLDARLEAKETPALLHAYSQCHFPPLSSRELAPLITFLQPKHPSSLSSAFKVLCLRCLVALTGQGPLFLEQVSFQLPQWTASLQQPHTVTG
jgi:hypothetical protein